MMYVMIKVMMDRRRDSGASGMTMCKVDEGGGDLRDGLVAVPCDELSSAGRQRGPKGKGVGMQFVIVIGVL